VSEVEMARETTTAERQYDRLVTGHTWRTPVKASDEKGHGVSRDSELAKPTPGR
jgi:hypothetical protein